MSKKIPLLDITSKFIKIGKGIKKIGDYSEEKRKFIQTQLDDTFTLLDSALMLVILRLGEIITNEDPYEGKFLDNDESWIHMERSVRLCENLRSTRRELKKIPTSTIDKLITVKEWDELMKIIDGLLIDEVKIGEAISKAFNSIASETRAYFDSSPTNDEAERQLFQKIINIHEEVKKLRIELITTQSRLWDEII